MGEGEFQEAIAKELSVRETRSRLIGELADLISIRKEAYAKRRERIEDRIEQLFNQLWPE